MDGRSQVPPAQVLDAMPMDELITSFNASLGTGRGSVYGTPSFWAQQVMHRQQLDIAERMEKSTNRMEKSTRMILGLTVVMAVTAIINVCIVVWATS